MKTLNGYTGKCKNKFNDKYNFVALFELSNGENVLMNASVTSENCEKAAIKTANTRIGFSQSTFKVVELTKINKS